MVIRMKRDFWLVLIACVATGAMVLWKMIEEMEDPEDEEETESPPPFVPTREWQEVKKGQAVPPVLVDVDGDN